MRGRMLRTARLRRPRREPRVVWELPDRNHIILSVLMRHDGKKWFFLERAALVCLQHCSAAADDQQPSEPI